MQRGAGGAPSGGLRVARRAQSSGRPVYIWFFSLSQTPGLCLCELLYNMMADYSFVPKTEQWCHCRCPQCWGCIISVYIFAKLNEKITTTLTSI